jgi:hypothetical protein
MAGPLQKYKSAFENVITELLKFEELRHFMAHGLDVQPPSNVIQQIGDLILKQVDEIPPSAVPVELETDADGRIHLGGGYFIGGAVEKPPKG